MHRNGEKAKFDWEAREDAPAKEYARRLRRRAVVARWAALAMAFAFTLIFVVAVSQDATSSRSLRRVFGALPARNGERESPLVHAVAAPGIRKHLETLEAIALAHPNHSRSVANAFNASAAYVMQQLREHTDCRLTTQAFVTPVWTEYQDPVISVWIEGDGQQAAASPLQLQPGTDFRAMRYGGNAAALKETPVKLVQHHGCTPESWTSFPRGAIALLLADLKAMPCSLWKAAFAAEKAGASAVLFYNTLQRTSLLGNRVRITGWLPGDPLLNIPALSLSHAVGEMMAHGKDVRVSLETFTSIEVIPTLNVLCETRQGDPNNVVMIGSHLDSVPEGPGLVDNGSGSSSVLEIALQLYKTNMHKSLQNKIRFAWWSAEELGLLGSRFYCAQLVQNKTEFERVLLYTNHDMLGSPNYVPYVHEGKTAPASVRNPSIRIQTVYEEYFQHLPKDHKFSNNYELDAMEGGSDFFSFLEVDIPSGGLATGAGGLKSMEQRHRFGGFANAPMDPCYHKSCDTVENVAMDVLETLAKSTAHFVQTLGMKKNVRQWLNTQVQ